RSKLELPRRSAKLNNISLLHLAPPGLLAVQHRAASAARVDKHGLSLLDLHLAMGARHLRVLEKRIRLVAATDDQGFPFFQTKEASLIGTGNDKQLTKHGSSCARAERSSYPDRYG